MLTILDTNILLRSSQPASPHHEAAIEAVVKLAAGGRILGIASQTIYEFLAVATRSVVDNGLGMAHDVADRRLAELLTGIQVFYDSPEVVNELRRLVVSSRVTGKQVHDARIAAVMSVAGLNEILTFNVADFRRFPHLTVLSPEQVIQPQFTTDEP